jgi:predicted nucleotidyltransferase component of viral defense system
MLNVSEHRKILIQILKDIYTDTSIASYLGFKGGTACLLFHGLDRFSVDLDFDLLDLKQQELVFKTIEKILLNYGKLKDKREKRYNLFFIRYKKTLHTAFKILFSLFTTKNNYFFSCSKASFLLNLNLLMFFIQ